jgi:uncharacterized membrane protein required for colicin V production
MTPFILDLVMLAVVAFCVFQGYRKGLILSAAGVLVVFVSIWGGGLVANRFQEPVAEMLVPVMSWITDDATDEAARGMGRLADITDKVDVERVSKDAFITMGIAEGEAEKLSGNVSGLVSEAGSSLRAGISKVFLDNVVYVLLYIFGYALFCILLTLLANFISTVFRLPGLHLLDKIGGSLLGLIYAFVFLWAVTFVLRYTGIFIGQDVIGESVLGNLFVNRNPFSSIIL